MLQYLKIGVLCVVISGVVLAPAHAKDPSTKWNEIFEDDGVGPFAEWDLLEEMRQLQEQMDEIFGPGQWAQGGTGMPSGKKTSNSGLQISQSESQSQYIITITTAADENTQVDVNLKGNVLSISSQTKSQSGSGGSTLQSMSAVSQAFTLPDDADPATIQTRREKTQVIVTIDKLGATSQNPAPPENQSNIQKKEETL